MGSNHNIVPLDSHPRARARATGGPASGALDLLAQIFDEIAAEPGLPAAVRSEIARLRIPALRAAQRVPDFLERRAHPARRLVDAIGVAALGVDESAGDGDPTVAAISAAVHDLLVDFEEDLAPFEAAAARLAEYVDERTRGDDEGARPLVQAIVQRELADVPRHVAQEEVARRLRSRLWVPQPVREMLSDQWVRALADAYSRDGEESEEWSGLVRTMDDLLWSVEPKASPEGRRRLAGILPDLVQAIVRGWRRAGASEAERDEFLSRLVDAHAHAMKAGMRGMALVPEPTQAQDLPPALARTTFSVGERRVEEIRLTPAAQGGTDAADEEVARLRVGAWVELERGARVAARKRLAWSSPVTGACLFLGLAPGSTGVCIDPAALAQLVRRGEARIVDDAPLIERALAAMLRRPTPGQG